MPETVLQVGDIEMEGANSAVRKVVGEGELGWLAVLAPQGHLDQERGVVSVRGRAHRNWTQGALWSWCLRAPGQGQGFAGLERSPGGSKVTMVVEPWLSWEELCL